jgi:hypothetical protein
MDSKTITPAGRPRRSKGVDQASIVSIRGEIHDNLLQVLGATIRIAGRMWTYLNSATGRVEAVMELLDTGEPRTPRESECRQQLAECYALLAALLGDLEAEPTAGSRDSPLAAELRAAGSAEATVQEVVAAWDVGPNRIVEHLQAVYRDLKALDQQLRSQGDAVQCPETSDRGPVQDLEAPHDQ